MPLSFRISWPLLPLPFYCLFSFTAYCQPFTTSPSDCPLPLTASILYCLLALPAFAFLMLIFLYCLMSAIPSDYPLPLTASVLYCICPLLHLSFTASWPLLLLALLLLIFLYCLLALIGPCPLMPMPLTAPALYCTYAPYCPLTIAAHFPLTLLHTAPYFPLSPTQHNNCPSCSSLTTPLYHPLCSITGPRINRRLLSYCLGQKSGLGVERSHQ